MAPEQADRGRLRALRFERNRQVTPFDPPAQHHVPRTAWRFVRRIRSESAVQVHEQLEDTLFYQRAGLRRRLLGEDVTSFHETLHVPRLVSPGVQAMLPWRMPRRG